MKQTQPKGKKDFLLAYLIDRPHKLVRTAINVDKARSIRTIFTVDCFDI